ncbi:aldolase/citrate lyase family protein [Nonomuraea sp. KM88]|uniref:aldolase/citrate lyase family protein n=1 Tax=Nonomuraea sp. KM88 TaxID=3457427 RepID=UPI003FCD41D7
MSSDRPRLRSLLFVPGTRTGWLAKAESAGADAAILDLEDAVPPAGKAAARADVAEAVANTTGDMALLVRINSLDGWAGAEDLRAVTRAVEDRMAALERTGARLFVERLRLEWRPATPIPEPGGRLRFRQVCDTEEILSLMTRVLEGTLDAHSRDDLTPKAPGSSPRRVSRASGRPPTSATSPWRTPSGAPDTSTSNARSS